MSRVMTLLRAAKIAAVLVAVVGVAACASNPTGQQAGVAGAGAAVPGSAQDFVVNVGDRVFFETDATELTPQSRTTLGAKRAQTVREYLVSRGIDGNRMRTISYGKERPVAVCNDISCWSQNRRAVTVLNASS